MRRVRTAISVIRSVSSRKPDSRPSSTTVARSATVEPHTPVMMCDCCRCFVSSAGANNPVATSSTQMSLTMGSGKYDAHTSPIDARASVDCGTSCSTKDAALKSAAADPPNRRSHFRPSARPSRPTPSSSTPVTPPR